MTLFLFSLALGLILATIDIIPMMIKKCPKHTIYASFFHFIVATVVIVNIHIDFIPWWLLGGILGLCLMLPMLIHVAQHDRRALPIIALNAILFGSIAKISAHLLMS